MTTKDKISFGEKMLKEYSDMLDTIKLLEWNKNDFNSIMFLLNVQRLEYESRVDGVKSKLEKLKKEYVVEFEKDSSETNVKIQDVVAESKKYIGKEPLGVTDEIKPLTDKFTDNKGWMDMSQEDRNGVYFKLKSHLYSIKNKMK